MEHLKSRGSSECWSSSSARPSCPAPRRRSASPPSWASCWAGSSGPSALGWVDPKIETIHMLSELGVIVLLLRSAWRLTSGCSPGRCNVMTVAVVGVVLPFVFGYVACRRLGKPEIVSIMAGATLTATSVGITARVLADLGMLGARRSGDPRRGGHRRHPGARVPRGGDGLSRAGAIDPVVSPRPAGRSASWSSPPRRVLWGPG